MNFYFRKTFFWIDWLILLKKHNVVLFSELVMFHAVKLFDFLCRDTFSSFRSRCEPFLLKKMNFSLEFYMFFLKKCLCFICVTIFFSIKVLEVFIYELLGHFYYKKLGL